MRLAATFAWLLLSTACGASTAESRGEGAGGAGLSSDEPWLIDAREAFGVGLPCTNAQSPIDLDEGGRWAAVSESGFVTEMEVTSSVEDDTCGVGDEQEYLITFEALDAEPHLRPEDGVAYRRCTEESGVGGSHASLREPHEGMLVMVRTDVVNPTRARVVRDPARFVPSPSFEGTYFGLDEDGDGHADWLIGDASTESDHRYPEGISGGYDCREIHRLEDGAWRLAYRGCRHRCQPVTH